MAATEVTNRALGEIKELIDAVRPLVYLKSAEEERVHQLLSDAAKQLFAKPVPLYTWTVTEGLRGSDGAPVGKDTVHPRAALDWIVACPHPALFNLRDFHDAIRSETSRTCGGGCAICTRPASTRESSSSSARPWC